MIPKKYDAHEYDYPDYQPDQVLSNDHLNHSFAFNDQQERLTRTNLIGIGIACGLKATRSADGKTVFISKGTGVTSQGYLVVHGKENSEESIEYKKYRSFAADIIKDARYDVLVAGTTPRYAIWELLDSAAAQPTDLDLSDLFLKDKVCLLFYEMLEVDAKNCDTTSCDDKGKTITITVRKLLVKYTDADKIITELNAKAQSNGSGEVFPGVFALPEIKLPRFDVIATGLGTTSDIYRAYQKVFTKTFVEGTGNAINSAYNIFKTYLKDSSNPFASFNSTFAFLHNNTINGNDLLHFQYYWDFFCDLIAAYNEWRLAALPLGAMCTPPEALFPRHLFLAYFGETEGFEKSKYRNYFIPSPVLSNQEQGYKEFKSLFQRLVRMVANKSLPVPTVVGTPLADTNIRITPSSLGSFPLGARAIPYYYKPNEASNKLVDVWNYAETKRGKQNLILSYKPTYNVTDDFVLNPLSYDLELYNFFRIEGHIGKAYANVLNNLKNLVNNNRLPIDVIALELSSDASDTTIDDVCSINNIQIQYELLANEMRCCLKKNIAYWGQLEVADAATAPTTAGTIFDTGIIFAHFDEKDMALNANIKAGGITETLNEIQQKFGSASPKIMAEVKRFVSSVSKTAETTSLDTPKANLLSDTIKVFSGNSIAAKYYDLQKKGNVSVGAAPVTSTVFNADTLSHYAMIIIDEMEEILLLLQAKDALSFDLEKLAKHTDALKKAYDTLSGLLSNYLNTQKAVYTIKTTIGESANLSNINAIAAAIPEIIDKNTSKVILLLLNPLDTTTTSKLITDLQKATTNAAKQQVIDTAMSKLDKDGMMIPPKKDITYIEDPVLRDVNDHLKNLSCLCGYDSFKTLHDLLQKAIDALKQFNLFSVFTKKHPGIQHKAGVTTGGTFIIAYHRKTAATLPQYDAAVKALADGIVVADFYLPYLCSSDCQPVNFNVIVPVPAVTLSLAKTEYCINDATPSYLFTANPTGGKLTTAAEQKDSLKDNGDGTFSFIPGKVAIPAGAKDVTVTFTYTLGNQMQTLNIKVYAYPEVKIVAEPDPTNALRVDLTVDRPDLVSSAVWVFGDNATAVDIATSHVYSAGGAYTVALTVKNGPCTFVAEPLVVNVKDPDPVVIGLNITQICKTAAAITFKVTPAGGTAVGEGFTESPVGSGNFTFTPSAVAANGTPQKIVIFSYTPLVGIGKTTSITVFEKPVADPVFIPIRGNNTDAGFQFTGLANASSLEMDFGDGSKATYNIQGLTTYKTISHLFPGAGPFTITAAFTNGTCALKLKPISLKLEVPKEVVKVCQLLSVPVQNYIALRKELSASERFIAAYDPENFRALDKFFSSLREQVSKDPNVPLSFFAQHPFDTKWVDSLPVNEEGLRGLSVRLLAILSDLITTISCLKGEDVNEGELQTMNFLEAIISKLKQLQMVNTGDKASIDAIVKDVNDEIARIKNNDEQKKKPQFADELRNILIAIKELS